MAATRFARSTLRPSLRPASALGRDERSHRRELPGRQAGAFGQRRELGPDDARHLALDARALGEATVAAADHILASDQVGESSQALGNQFRVFDMADRMTDHAGYEDLALGKLYVLPDRPLPLVARIGRLDRKPLGIDLQNQVRNNAERHVTGVRPRP